jgi:transcriptional regulator with XRE-family HTH domain
LFPQPGQKQPCARQAQGWSQALLAEKAETSMNYIGMLENTVKFPLSEMIQKLAFALGIDPTGLFQRKWPPYPP